VTSCSTIEATVFFSSLPPMMLVFSNTPITSTWSPGAIMPPEPISSPKLTETARMPSGTMNARPDSARWRNSLVLSTGSSVVMGERVTLPTTSSAACAAIGSAMSTGTRWMRTISGPSTVRAGMGIAATTTGVISTCVVELAELTYCQAMYDVKAPSAIAATTAPLPAKICIEVVSPLRDFSPPFACT
jgi:hypothetical protein